MNTPTTAPVEAQSALTEKEFSALYQDGSPEEYASQVDESTLLADFESASVRYSNNESNLAECAHGIAAFVNVVRKSDGKIDAALTKNPRFLIKLIQNEGVKAVHDFRERVLHLCGR